MGWHFSIQAEEFRGEWWLNAGGHGECALIPQNERIQKEGSCRHPFLYFSSSPLHSFLLFSFPNQCIKEWKFCFKTVLSILSLFPSFCLFTTPFFFLYFCLVSSSSPWILLFFPLDPPRMDSCCALFAVWDSALGTRGCVSVTRNQPPIAQKRCWLFLLLVSDSALFSQIVSLIIKTSPA